MHEDTVYVPDYRGSHVRMPAGWHDHLERHPKYAENFERLTATIEEPDLVVATSEDPSVHFYHKLYPVSQTRNKYLRVVVQIQDDDAYVLVAFYAREVRAGLIVWQA